jgi:DNA-binding XRE family transcriptional regulator
MKLTFSDLLRFHRARLGLSQAAVSKMIDVPLRTLWAWEAGVNTPNHLTQWVVIACLESLSAERRMVAKVRIKRGRKPVKQESPTAALQEGTLRPTRCDCIR